MYPFAFELVRLLRGEAAAVKVRDAMYAGEVPCVIRNA